MEFSSSEIMKILESSGIPIISDSVNYWFIRTNGGENFENFYFNCYVAIGWDEIHDLDLIKKLSYGELKKLVENLYPQDTKPGSTASQIKRFVCEMKPGDYVLIPGTNCDRIAIGIITSNAYIYRLTDQDRFDSLFDGTEVTYFKRRNVKWIANRPFERHELDPMLIPIIYSYGTIVNANPYSGFINRTLYSCYIQGNEMHAIFDVAKTGNIPAIYLYDFMDSIFNSVKLYGEIYDCPVKKEDLSIKAAINSPGPIEIITAATSLFILLSALALFINGAKIKFSFDIFHIAKGDLDIDTPGLIDKITEHNKISNNNLIKLEKAEAEITESKEKLKIKKKENKK